MRKVLVLGGAGFIGSEIVRILSERDAYTITVADNLTHGDYRGDLISFYNCNNIKFIKADFSDFNSFNLLDSKYDDVYMLASKIGVNNTLENPHEVIRVNTSLILNTLEWLRNSSISNLLFTSTSECYSGTIDTFGFQVPTPENVPLCITNIAHPRFTYSVTKMLGESGFINYGKVFGFNVKIVRYNNIIGPNMGFGHILPHLVERFLLHKETPFKIYGAQQTRAFCDIYDGALGTILAMEYDGNSSEIFHIGSDVEVTIEEFVKEVGRHFGYFGPYVLDETFPGSVNRRCPDLTKTRSLLGYSPSVDWRSTVKRSVQWYTDYFSLNKFSFFKDPHQVKSLIK
jgi:nucleoside-diphosphate-sugar epimerase